MKKIILLTALVFVGITSLKAQKPEDEKKYFYRDTTFEYNGNKYEITRCISNDKMFKCGVTVTNITNNFLIFNPGDIFGSLNGSSAKITAMGKRWFVIPPKYSKRFTVKIEGVDCRVNKISIDMSKIQMSSNVLNTYNLPDLDFLRENKLEVGPLRWILKDRKPERDGTYRIVAEVSYTGNKFLALMYNNIVLKTLDGGKFMNTGRRNEDFYYENGKPEEKCILSFPIEEKMVNKKNAPTISFPNVFKEYALLPSTGPKFTLTRGTEADYKGLNRSGNNIDENDNDDK